MPVANQYVITIHKNKYERDFLSISKDEWIIASTLLTYSEFKVFLYLAGNADGYALEYSPQAISNKLDMNRSTASEARRSLEVLGYLDPVGGNHYSFYTKPRRVVATNTSTAEEKTAARKQDHAEQVLVGKGIPFIFR